MRRLYSTFARGLPGVGLLLLRLAAGGVLIAHGIGRLLIGTPLETSIPGIFSIGDGALLVAGLWTPMAGSLLVLIEVLEHLTQDQNPFPTILLATMGAAIALVGPGAWSLDARLFGWKRIDVERR